VRTKKLELTPLTAFLGGRERKPVAELVARVEREAKQISAPIEKCPLPLSQIHAEWLVLYQFCGFSPGEIQKRRSNNKDKPEGVRVRRRTRILQSFARATRWRPGALIFRSGPLAGGVHAGNRKGDRNVDFPYLVERFG